MDLRFRAAGYDAPITISEGSSPVTEPDRELAFRAMEIINEQVPVITTCINADGIVIVHRPGCSLIREQQRFGGVLPAPDKIRECACMPNLQEVMKSLRH
jgi:hypothetical protein